MEAPKCKLCDKRHYGLCLINAPDVPQYIIDEAASNMGKVASNSASNKGYHSKSEMARVETLKSYDKKQRWDRDKYNEYQRGYMRRRRNGMQGEEG